MKFQVIQTRNNNNNSKIIGEIRNLIELILKKMNFETLSASI